jgi:hypothetical protein
MVVVVLGGDSLVSCVRTTNADIADARPSQGWLNGLYSGSS